MATCLTSRQYQSGLQIQGASAEGTCHSYQEIGFVTWVLHPLVVSAKSFDHIQFFWIQIHSTRWYMLGGSWVVRYEYTLNSSVKTKQIRKHNIYVNLTRSWRIQNHLGSCHVSLQYWTNQGCVYTYQFHEVHYDISIFWLVVRVRIFISAINWFALPEGRNWYNAGKHTPDCTSEWMGFVKLYGTTLPLSLPLYGSHVSASNLMVWCTVAWMASVFKKCHT